MKIGILGTGMVGRRLGSALAARGHDVRIGGRSEGGDAARSWVAETGERASEGSFADAAAFGDMVILAVRGDAALDVVRAAGTEALRGKVLVDVTNPLDFSQGFPPKLIDGLHNTTSLGEAIQAALPETDVVKSLNTMSNMVMVDPGSLAQPTDVFVAGNDAAAKAAVAGLLSEFGWGEPIDLGGIEAARGLEAILLFWTRVMGPMGGDGMFNMKLVGTHGG